MRTAKKMRSQRGETLVEILASILIGTMAIALLVGSVTTSSRIDVQTKQSDAEHYQALSAAELQQTALSMPGAKVSIQLLNPSPAAPPVENPKDFTVVVYGGEGIYSYKIST